MLKIHKHSLTLIHALHENVYPTELDKRLQFLCEFLCIFFFYSQLVPVCVAVALFCVQNEMNTLFAFYELGAITQKSCLIFFRCLFVIV